MGYDRCRVVAERAGSAEIYSGELGWEETMREYGGDVDAVTTKVEQSIQKTVRLEILLVAGRQKNTQRVVVEGGIGLL